MAGIGVELNKIYEKNTISAYLCGFFYSVGITVAPLFLIILNIFIMGKVLGFTTVGYASRELFSCTVLYIFIFALLIASLFNSVLSKYMSDVIYEERYDDILPCFYLGLLLDIAIGCALGVPFCLWEHFVGGVSVLYVFTGFCGFIFMVFIFYSMLYLSICKDYKRISLYYLIGMAAAFILSYILVKRCGWSITFGMLFSLIAGFFIIACFELAVVKQYFKTNSHNYRRIFDYLQVYYKLILTNFFYVLGLYIHNFVFWCTNLRMTVAKSFVCAQPYDVATFLAMLTSISATVIFISRVEMNFHQRYKAYVETVIGGRGMDIKNAKNRMFRQISAELMNLVRIQFIISVITFLLFMVVLPRLGFSGMVMQIYPCLAAGYFILFIMYSEIIFLYYFNDTSGALITSLSFFAITFAGSVFATHLNEIWYGTGVVIGAAAGWAVAYYRLRLLEKNMDAHIFCKGTILKRGKGKRPQDKVFDAYKNTEEMRREP